MQIIELSAPENVLSAINAGKKLAVFAVDEEKNALFLVSDVKYNVLQNSVKSDNLIAPALRYIDAHYNKDIKLAVLADKCDISPSYFSRLFSSFTGCSISAYVLEKRLNKACELLATTDRSVVGIACDVGYVDCGYFYKLFRKKYGCTPLEYRASRLSVAATERKQ